MFVLAMVAVRWDPRTGLTSLLRFGIDYRERQIAAVASLPIALKPNHGYDGQFYAQMAVSCEVLDPELHRALDNPGYRLRRILLPAVAHVLGGCDAWRTLHIYALANVVAWLALGWMLWRILAPSDLRDTAAWLGSMLSLGALDSVRMALTDVPAMALMVGAILLARRGRQAWAIGTLAVTGLVRETAILSVAALGDGAGPARSAWRTRLLHAAAVAAPIALWSAWLFGQVSSIDPLGRANFDWPLAAMATHAARWGGAVLAGDLETRHVFGLLAIGSFAWQSASVLGQWRSPSPWVRMALPFAVLFWILGDAVWHGYWAVARACLPMTLAFNLTLPRDRSFAWRWALGNICVLHAVWRFLPE